MQTSVPQISVVIPTHNRAEWLSAAVASVLRSPLIRPEQVIVVDDDSTDGTRDVICSSGVKYVRGVYRGPSGARNAGFAITTTEYVAFLDDDDEWLPGNMEAQLAALEADRTAGFAFGLVEAATEDMRPTGVTFPSLPLPSGSAPDVLHRRYPQLGSVLFRREAVAEVGGFDTRIRYQQDGDLLLRIAARHAFICLETVGALYRDRAPGRRRSDYYWSHRSVTNWWPREVGWVTKARFAYSIRRLFLNRFLEDALASAEVGAFADTAVCLARALVVMPPYFVGRLAEVTRTLRLCKERAHQIASNDERSLATAQPQR